MSAFAPLVGAKRTSISVVLFAQSEYRAEARRSFLLEGNTASDITISLSDYLEPSATKFFSETGLRQRIKTAVFAPRGVRLKQLFHSRANAWF